MLNNPKSITQLLKRYVYVTLDVIHRTRYYLRYGEIVDPFVEFETLVNKK